MVKVVFFNFKQNGQVLLTPFLTVSGIDVKAKMIQYVNSSQRGPRQIYYNEEVLCAKTYLSTLENVRHFWGL